MKKLVVASPLSWPNVSKQVFSSYLDLVSPAVQRDLKEKHDIELVTLIENSFPLDFCRNRIVDRVLHEFQADYVFWADMDNIWPENTLSMLLETICDEFPIVSGIYHRKKPPHYPVIGQYSKMDAYIQRFTGFLHKNGWVDKLGDQTLFFTPYVNYDNNAPFLIDVSGMGSLLMDTKILRHLIQPIFEYHTFVREDGTEERVTEEVGMWSQIKKLGIYALADPRVQVGHVTEQVIDGRTMERPKIEVVEPILMEI